MEVSKEQVTLEKLFSKKMDNEKKNSKEFYSQELGGVIEIKKIPIRKIIGLLNECQTDDIQIGFELNQHIIYMCCPIFQNKQLQEQYEVVEPFEIVGKIFNENIGEIAKLSGAILEFYGLSGEELSQAVKKQ